MFGFEIVSKFIFHSTIKAAVIGPSITGPLIGAIIGSTFTWVLARGTEFYRFNKKRKESMLFLILKLKIIFSI